MRGGEGLSRGREGEVGVCQQQRICDAVWCVPSPRSVIRRTTDSEVPAACVGVRPHSGMPDEGEAGGLRSFGHEGGSSGRDSVSRPSPKSLCGRGSCRERESQTMR